MYRLLIVFILMSMFSYAQPSNVLFVGNSYTHMNNLYRIYANLANSKGKMVFTDTLAVSGSSIREHALRANTYKKIKSKNWDFVFIQGYSRELSYDSARIATETIPYAQLMIDSIKKYNPCAQIYYYMTWGYADGFSDSIPNDNYFLMQERIQRGYIQLSQATGGYPIAPVGMVWQEVRKRYPDINLYEADKAHPTIYGSFLAACTFYAAVYNKTPLDGSYPKKIEPIHALNIQQTAADYVIKNCSFYNLDTLQLPPCANMPKVDFSIKEKWLSITLTNKSSGGSQYFWDFGDGKTSTLKNPKHYYAKSGKYTVTLYVKSNCNWFKTTKFVKVSNKEKEANAPIKPAKPVKPKN